MPANASGRAQGPAQSLTHRQEDRHHRTADGGNGPDLALGRFLRTVGAAPARPHQRELARDGFTVWLVAQRHRNDWIGHLAKDAAYDVTWPRHATRLRELHDYLYEQDGMAAAHAALDQAWAEWREVAR
jgi:uncharacterized protein YozE (UPF0346 family)